MSSIRVLVVDDDPDICDFVQTLLHDEGYAVAVATQGAVALTMLHQHRPDIILLDLRMPVMDGTAFVRAYAQTPDPHARIIVLTATSDIGIIVETLIVDAILEKPFSVEQLLDLLAQYSPPATPSTEANAPPNQRTTQTSLSHLFSTLFGKPIGPASPARPRQYRPH